MSEVEQRVDTVLTALEQAGVKAPLRKALPSADRPASPCEVDLLVPGMPMRRLEEVLAVQGFRRFAAPGQPGHRFYLDVEDGRWIKLDAKIRSRGRRDGTGSSRPARWAKALRRRRPLAPRRLGPVVAVIGPDGAGKGTVVAALEDAIPVATQAVYLGLRTRRAAPSAPAAGTGSGAGGPSAPTAAGSPGGWRRRLEPLLVTKGLLHHALTLARAYLGAWQGRIVLCDRHPLEALAIDPRTTRLARVIERVVVRRVFPWPDRVIVLDAPAEVMFARKQEHGVERIERWRQCYRHALAGRGTKTVDTSGSIDDAVRAASQVVWEALAERRRW